MELALNKGLNEMSRDEMKAVDGGIGVAAGIGIGCLVTWVVDGVSEATTGKTVSGWISTGINWIGRQF